MIYALKINLFFGIGLVSELFVPYTCYYITVYVCVTNFYHLSALVGCLSPVSIRRIINKVLNVCPFDYTAVAVSGKLSARKPVKPHILCGCCLLPFQLTVLSRSHKCCIISGVARRRKVGGGHKFFSKKVKSKKKKKEKKGHTAAR